MLCLYALNQDSEADKLWSMMKNLFLPGNLIKLMDVTIEPEKRKLIDAYQLIKLSEVSSPSALRYKEIADIFYNKNDYDSALHYYTQAYNLEPDAETVMQLIMIYKTIGEYTKAIEFAHHCIGTAEKEVHENKHFYDELATDQFINYVNILRKTLVRLFFGSVEKSGQETFPGKEVLLHSKQYIESSLEKELEDYLGYISLCWIHKDFKNAQIIYSKIFDIRKGEVYIKKDILNPKNVQIQDIIKHHFLSLLSFYNPQEHQGIIKTLMEFTKDQLGIFSSLPSRKKKNTASQSFEVRHHQIVQAILLETYEKGQKLSKEISQKTKHLMEELKSPKLQENASAICLHKNLKNFLHQVEKKDEDLKSAYEKQMDIPEKAKKVRETLGYLEHQQETLETYIKTFQEVEKKSNENQIQRNEADLSQIPILQPSKSSNQEIREILKELEKKKIEDQQRQISHDIRKQAEKEQEPKKVYSENRKKQEIPFLPSTLLVEAHLIPASYLDLTYDQAQLLHQILTRKYDLKDDHQETCKIILEGSHYHGEINLSQIKDLFSKFTGHFQGVHHGGTHEKIGGVGLTLMPNAEGMKKGSYYGQLKEARQKIVEIIAKNLTLADLP